MASIASSASLSNVYAERGGAERSLALKGWKKVGENWERGGQEVSELDDTIAYLALGALGAFETVGRCMASYVVGNRLSGTIAKLVETINPDCNGYEEVKQLLDQGFEDSVHAVAQCFNSMANHGKKLEEHLVDAKGLRQALDDSGMIMDTMSKLQQLDPITVAVMIYLGNTNPELFTLVLGGMALKYLNDEEVNDAEESYGVLVQKLVLSTHTDEQTVHEIPPFLESNEIFAMNRCPISKRAIRFIMIVEDSDGNGVFYEKKEVEKWLELKDSPPPSWLKGVPLKKESLKPANLSQGIIDKELRRIILDCQENQQSIIAALLSRSR